MTPAVDVSAQDAIGFLAFLVAYGGGALPVYLGGERWPRTYLEGTVTELGVDLARKARRWDEVRSLQVEIGLPERPAATVLWAWAESKDSAWRARTGNVFGRYLPTMVLKMGASARRLLLWGLKEPLPSVSVEPANKRIAYALRTPQKYSGLEKLRIPVPGSFLRVGRKRPSPVIVTRMDVDAFYTHRQLVGRLKDPPRPFMERLRAGEVAK